MDSYIPILYEEQYKDYINNNEKYNLDIDKLNKSHINNFRSIQLIDINEDNHKNKERLISKIFESKKMY